MVQRIGIVGCGVISDIYLRNASLFRDIEIVACADARPEAAKKRAENYGIAALTPADLFASPGIDIVLNLTNPEAHASVSADALEAGKHVYSEKPLATSLEDGQRLLAIAARTNRRIASAPDTILGPGLQDCRQMIDDGTIGPVISGVATIMSRGMEHWHPAPEYYFKPGGGPVLDMGPYYVGALVTLLGPVREVTAVGRVGLAERVVTAEGPNLGQRIGVETPTTVHAILNFASGAQIALLASWDVWKHAHFPMELHGEAASLRVPDPNFFGGMLEFAVDRDEWAARQMDERFYGTVNYPQAAPRYANYRGMGLAEMAKAIEEGREHRLDGPWAFHILETMLAVLRSAESGRRVAIESTCARPAYLPDDEAMSLLVDTSPSASRMTASTVQPVTAP